MLKKYIYHLALITLTLTRHHRTNIITLPTLNAAITQRQECLYIFKQEHIHHHYHHYLYASARIQTNQCVLSLLCYTNHYVSVLQQYLYWNIMAFINIISREYDCIQIYTCDNQCSIITDMSEY